MLSCFKLLYLGLVSNTLNVSYCVHSFYFKNYQHYLKGSSMKTKFNNKKLEISTFFLVFPLNWTLLPDEGLWVVQRTPCNTCCNTIFCICISSERMMRIFNYVILTQKTLKKLSKRWKKQKLWHPLSKCNNMMWTDITNLQ